MLPGKFCAINRSLDEMKFFGKGILEKKKNLELHCQPRSQGLSSLLPLSLRQWREKTRLLHCGSRIYDLPVRAGGSE